jgi:hypothetical protein
MRNISKLLQEAGSFGLVLLAGLTSPTPATIRNARPMRAAITEELTWANVKVSNSEILQKSLAAKALKQEQYKSELAKLDALDRAKDLDGLIRVADDLEKRWGRPGGQYYGLLMLEISNLLENHFRGAGIFATSQKYVSNALAKSDSFPLWLETRLLRFLSRDVTSADSSDPAPWSRERRTKVGFWLHAWGRLETQINRNFDFSDRPKLNVMPPKETGLPAGIVPEGIRDPKLRAQYEAALAANGKKGREYNRQFELRKLDETFPKVAEGYLVRVYSRPPYQTEELRRHLIAHRLNRQIRERVLSQVNRNLTMSQ